MKRGLLSMVSVGPGFTEHITPRAAEAISDSEVIVSYDLYLRWVQHLVTDKEIVTLPLTQEKARASAAIKAARSGKRVAILSSGDIGVYGMAPLVFEDLSDDDNFDVVVVPGITSAQSSSSLLGAPLSHDYAVLSLSDLLCPWDWIKERAGHAAAADLCIAIYNVQSKQRATGVYEILQILSKHKGASTVCGIVRNAYRPDQTTTITTLGELHAMQFDMFTTLVIGNRFTQHKRNWMFTPRGYNSWDKTSDTRVSSAVSAAPPVLDLQNATAPERDLPHNAVWIFSGTSDGNLLASAISDSGAQVVISAATSYGAQIIQAPSQIVFGKVGEARRRELLQSTQAKAIVDATHPYADVISEQLMKISAETGVPYLRFERSPASMQGGDASIHWATSWSDALRIAKSLGRRIFLTTGSKHLPDATQSTHDSEFFVRITPDADGLRKVLESGIPPANIVCMQGPFSCEMNLATWRTFVIDVVVTRDSGDAGGFSQKLEAAQQMNIPMVVIKRPEIDYTNSCTTTQDAIKWINQLGVLK